MSVLRTESYKKGVINSTFFNIIAKGLGFVNSLLIVYLFGAGFKTDLYFVILSTAIVVTSFINGIDTLVLIPEGMRRRISEGEDSEKKFLNFFVWLYVGIGLLIGLFIFLAPVIFYSLFSKFDIAGLRAESAMLMASCILIPLTLLTNLFISILASYKHFTVPMIVSFINSAISISAILLLGRHISIFGALIGQLVGATVNFIWLVFYFRKHLNWPFTIAPPLPSKKLVTNIFLTQLNILPVSVRSFATTFFLSGIGAGIITALNYGQQLAYIPEVLIVTQVIAVIGIKFNELSAKNEREELNAFFSGFMKLLLITILPVGAIISLTSQDIVDTLFAFTNKIEPITRANIAMVVFFFALTLPARALDLAMTRLVMAQQRIKEGVVFGVIIHVIITICVIAGILTYGLKGFLVAIFIGYNLFLPIVYYFLLNRIAPFIRYLGWIRDSAPMLSFNIVLIVAFYLARKFMLQDTPPLLNILLIGSLYMIAIIFFNYFARYYTPLNGLIRKLILRK